MKRLRSTHRIPSPVLGEGRGEGGMTLLEVMIVVAIVAIMAGIAVPNFMSLLPKMRVNTVVREFVGEVLKAKMSAVRENVEYRIYIDMSVTPNQYKMQKKVIATGTFVDVDSVELPQGVVINSSNAWPSGNFVEPFNYISVLNCSYCGMGTTGWVSFMSDGTSSDGSVIFIPSDDNCSGCRTDRMKAVVIIATTGVATVVSP